MEIELQYLYAGERQPIIPIDLAGFALAESSRFQVLDTYFDSAALDLRRNGASLRVRQAQNSPNPLIVFKSPATRRDDGAKVREETEVPIDLVPDEAMDLDRVLEQAGLADAVARVVDCDPCELHGIGELVNDRSLHVYANGLHRLELTWDRLAYPLGPPETRLEVEARTEAAARFLDRVDEELRGLFGKALTPASQGKSRELCERLYPELLAA
jgi:hypothetical protein